MGRNVRDSLCHVATRLISSALAPTTTKTYNKTLEDFQQFVEELGVVFTYPVNPGHIVLYMSRLFTKGFASSTITSKLSAISYAHKLRSKQDSTQHFLVQKCLLGIRKSSPSVDLRLPITIEMLFSLQHYAPDVTPSFFYATMLRAMMTLSFFGLLRPGEVTGSVNNLQLHSVSIKQGSIHIKFYRFKHHQGPPVTIVVPPHNSPICPVRNLRLYLPLRGSAPGPLFCTPSRRPISYAQYHHWFQALLNRCSIHGRYNLHSFRIGAATRAISKGVSTSLLQQMGRWHSGAYSRYIRLPTVSV